MSTKTYRVALCSFLDDAVRPYFFSFDGKPDDCMNFGGAVRVSEIVTVEFPMLPPERSVATKVSILDQQIAAITEEFAKQLNTLKSRKAELLAITHEEPV